MKNLLTIMTAILWGLTLQAQQSITASPRTFGKLTLPGSDQPWSGIENVSGSDDTYASFNNITGGTGSYTDYLVAYDFDFNIPLGATITGIKVEVECSDPNARTADHSVRIVKTGTPMGNEKALGTNYLNADEYMIYGGVSDLWGEAWDDKFINDNNFGIAISARRSNTGNTTAGQIDHIRITVYFNQITLPVILTFFNAVKENNSVKVKWSSASESGIQEYQVQRSSDGRSFYSLANIPARNQANSDYVHADYNALAGVSYYRLKIEEQGGTVKYSSIVRVSFANESAVTLYPVPWQQGTDLNITNENRGKLFVYFYSPGGHLISTVVTDSKIVPTGSLITHKGMVTYKIYDTKNNLLGKGTMLVL